jgi:hypothetical protein
MSIELKSIYPYLPFGNRQCSHCESPQGMKQSFYFTGNGLLRRPAVGWTSRNDILIFLSVIQTFIFFSP